MAELKKEVYYWLPSVTAKINDTPGNTLKHVRVHIVSINEQTVPT